MRFSSSNSSSSRSACAASRGSPAGRRRLHFTIVSGCILLIWFAGDINYENASKYLILFDLPGGSSSEGGGRTKKGSAARSSSRLPIPCKGKERVLEILERAVENAVDKKCRSSVTSLLAATTANTENTSKQQQQQRLTKALNMKKKPGSSSSSSKNKQEHVYGMTTCDMHVMCDQLPQWKQVAHLYGDTPVVLGLETCAQYRETLLLLQQQQNINNNNATMPTTTTIAPAVRVAGLYNSGTNALTAALADNAPQFNTDSDSSSDSSWEVPWGKHAPAHARDTSLAAANTATDAVLPVVVVRDPFRWMTSMVRSYSCMI